MPRDFYPDHHGRRRGYPTGPPPPFGAGSGGRGGSYDPDFDARNYANSRRAPPPPPMPRQQGPMHPNGGRNKMPPMLPKGGRGPDFYHPDPEERPPFREADYGAMAEPRERKSKHKSKKHKSKHSKDGKKRKHKVKSLVDYDFDNNSSASGDEYSSVQESPRSCERFSPPPDKPRRRHSPATAIQEYKKQLVNDRSHHTDSPSKSRHSSSKNSKLHVSPPRDVARSYRGEAPKAYVNTPRAYRTPSHSPSPKKARYRSRSPSPYARKRSPSPHRYVKTVNENFGDFCVEKMYVDEASDVLVNRKCIASQCSS